MTDSTQDRGPTGQRPVIPAKSERTGPEPVQVEKRVPPKYPVIDIRVCNIVIDETFENIRIDRTLADDPVGASFYAGKIQALAEDISEHGLFHPLTVRQTPAEEPHSNGSIYHLRAGFRRFKAVCLLEWSEVQASIIPPGASPELDYWINIQENLEREDLGGYEIAEAALRMQTLFGRTGADFAREIKRTPSYVNNLIRWRRTLPKSVLDDWRRGHEMLSQSRIEKLSHMSEVEASANWAMTKGHLKVPVLIRASGTTLSRLGIPKRPSVNRLADLRAEIATTTAIRSPKVRELCEQIVEFCQGTRKTIPEVYPPPKEKKNAPDAE